MSTITSLLVILKDGSWRPVLKKYRKRILSRRRASSKMREEGEIRVHEKADSGVVLNQSLLELKPAEEEEEVVEVSQKSEDILTTHRALRIVRKGTYALHEALPLPEFQHDEEVMIKSYAAGLNPIDWKSVDYNFCLPAFPWVSNPRPNQF